MKNIGEHRDRWDAGFRSPLLRIFVYGANMCFMFETVHSLLEGLYLITRVKLCLQIYVI